MKQAAAIAVLSVASAFGAVSAIPTTEVAVYFSPHAKDASPLAAVEAVLDHAATEINVMGYNFTSAPIADALCQAKERGVKVAIILDSDSLGGSCKAQQCHEGGCMVFVDSSHAIQHNKVMVVDGKIVLTGSYNWSGAAEFANAENLLVIRDGSLAKKYNDEFARHLGEKKCVKFVGAK